MLLLLTFLTLILPILAVGPYVQTTTGPIVGSEVAPGVLSWKGIPFAVPPTGMRRWTPPVLNEWVNAKNTTALSPACVQQLDKSQAATDPGQIFYNTPPLAEDEDCLTINVWAPSNSSGKPKAVLFWIYGQSVLLHAYCIN
jgi:para-nitrobenzyl esterase